MNEKKTDALLRDIEGLPSDIIENVSYEDGMKIAEQYKWYERKIAEQQKQLEEIYELLVGDNGIKRYTHEELIDSIKVTNEQIAVWQDKENEKIVLCSDNSPCEYQVDRCGTPIIEE